jgi:flagellar biosynthesis regulator FlaF
MSTQVTGKLGGQYQVRCVTDDIYMVSGLLHSEYRTIYKGDYKVATKLMDYCAAHDSEAQQAIQALYFEADPTPIIKLISNAQDDPEAKPRRRVQCWVRVATDVLESENAIDMVTSRISAAAGLAGLTITQLEVHYADPNEKFVDPPTDITPIDISSIPAEPRQFTIDRRPVE